MAGLVDEPFPDLIRLGVAQGRPGHIRRGAPDRRYCSAPADPDGAM